MLSERSLRSLVVQIGTKDRPNNTKLPERMFLVDWISVLLM